jgi:hypothetical protein
MSSDYGIGMKIFVWVAVITLVVTAVAPLFYIAAAPSYEEEVIVEETLNLDETDLPDEQDSSQVDSGLDLVEKE